MKIEITKGKAYEITDNTIILVELDIGLTEKQLHDMIHAFDATLVRLFSKDDPLMGSFFKTRIGHGVKVKVVENKLRE